MGDIQRRLLTAGMATVLALAPFAAGVVSADGFAVDDPDYSVAEDEILTVLPEAGVLANDTGGTALLCVTAFDATSLQGTLNDDPLGDGAFEFDPPDNFNGVTTFTYAVATKAGDVCPAVNEGTATVTITVTPFNDPPTAIADFFAALADRTLNVAAPGVLGNDSDIDGDSLSAVKVNNPAHGTLTLAADGGFSYTPSNGYRGPDAFSYRASDGQATSPVRVVNLTVSAIPPTPTPTPAPTPTPTPTPTASPEPSPTESPSPSDSGLPSPSPLDTGLLGSPSPSPSPAGPVAGESGPPIFALGALGLLVLLLGVAGVYFVRSQRAGDNGGYDSDGGGGTDNRGSYPADVDDDGYDSDAGDGADGESDAGDDD